MVSVDLCLPDIDGTDILRKFRQCSRAPVIVVTVRSGGEEKVALLDAGAAVGARWSRSAFLSRLDIKCPLG